MAYLLDVNMLVALSRREHALHAPATRWFADGASAGWATTPVTEAALVRLSMNARVSDRPVSWATALQAVATMRSVPGHRWVADDVDLVENGITARVRVVGHRQVTDVHLAALAAHHGLRLATLDRAVSDALHPDDRHVVEIVSVA